ncbi:hypothetical protein J2S36_000953 [Arcanobacterium hippocoleae]|uniref:HTH-like domain-containing protein n=1 Tax=Arcanobacterium hippocoleae TaxID=149017 RepID=A0ABU1T2D2_9ACTO|nr:hypothetical protein [Arcanobacterium hippocoleae]
MIYPLVRELAAQRFLFHILVRFSCRVLKISWQDYYKWVKQPISRLEMQNRALIERLAYFHGEDPYVGYRILADDLNDEHQSQGRPMVCERRVWRLCNKAGVASQIIRRKGGYRKAGIRFMMTYLSVISQLLVRTKCG